MKSVGNKKFIIMLLVLLWISSYASTAFSSIAPEELYLYTQVESYSVLTVNEGVGNATITTGVENAIPYRYEGNEPVQLTVTSANGLKLVHTSSSSNTINYTMTLDYGNGHVSVINGVPTALVDDNGLYDLSKSMLVTPESGSYRTGTYTDTLTFMITANL